LLPHLDSNQEPCD